MKILKWVPVALAAVHGGFSVTLLGISHLMPMGGLGGGIGHITALLAFVLNLPGVLTLKPFYTSSPSDGPFSVFLGSLGMIVITDIYVLLLLTVLCFGIAKAMKWANQSVEATADPQSG
jgi:hypothetical protein